MGIDHVPWCNQKVNDFWYQFDASIFIIFLLLSSIPCFLKCTTFGHIKKERCLTKFCRIKKAFRTKSKQHDKQTSCLQNNFVCTIYRTPIKKCTYYRNQYHVV